MGTGFLSVKLSNHLISSIRKQLPVITHSINEGIIGLEKELESMGGIQVLSAPPPPLHTPAGAYWALISPAAPSATA